jgi:hypothetical protein
MGSQGALDIRRNPLDDEVICKERVKVTQISYGKLGVEGRSDRP